MPERRNSCRHRPHGLRSQLTFGGSLGTIQQLKSKGQTSFFFSFGGDIISYLVA